MKTRQEINLLFLNEDVITPLLPETNRGSSFHPPVIGPIRWALPHRDKRKAACRKTEVGGVIEKVYVLCGRRDSVAGGMKSTKGNTEKRRQSVLHGLGMYGLSKLCARHSCYNGK